jgi:dTDP-4-amino-4,6-dideoxygalactose transaminase
MQIPFNKPYLPYVSIWKMIRAAMGGTISGNGVYTKRCHRFFEERYGFRKVLLTTSCTDALEMASILCDIQPGDEVIVPSFTFMSTANAFLLRNAKVVFADTLHEIPNIDPGEIENLTTNRTKAISVVHYSGVACDMDRIIEHSLKTGIPVVEDAAHAIDSYYRGKPLGSIGNFGAFSFHETKNIISGEGGMLSVNREENIKRAEIIWEKGTNRAAFYRGEIDKYGWVDIGSSFLPSDAVGAFLYTQLQRFDRIQNKRKKIWNAFNEGLAALEEKGFLKRPVVPAYATVNGNMFYFVANSGEERDRLIGHLKNKGIQAVFHYFPLHESPYFKEKHDGRPLPNTKRFSECLIRLPFFNDLTSRQIGYILDSVRGYYNK